MHSPAGCAWILMRSSLMTGSLLMTTLVGLVFLCLRRLMAPLSGMNIPATLVARTRSAIYLIANTRLAATHPIHAPTPQRLA